jgi:hypothetical protein
MLIHIYNDRYEYKGHEIIIDEYSSVEFIAWPADYEEHYFDGFICKSPYAEGASKQEAAENLMQLMNIE